jgi:hypothetical protein
MAQPSEAGRASWRRAILQLPIEATIGFLSVAAPDRRAGDELVRKPKIADVKDLLPSGELIGAARAMQIGLFNRLGIRNGGSSHHRASATGVVLRQLPKPSD